ncbi:MAG: nucleotide sugar dehydrogenase [Candidatus Omnitrophica bacterium]|nr:nucleotide sugar dehydrogenase [Candidatus Omnitrophota bacterium]
MSDSVFYDFLKRLKQKKIKLAVVGLGYVGLPLAISFVKAGLRVLGIDKDKDRVRKLQKKHSYITDVSNKELRAALKTKRFHIFQTFTAIKDAQVIIICVPTPLKRKYHPDISYIKEAVKAISKNLAAGSLIILESTTYPGTTEEVILPLLEAMGLRHNRDFYLAFSPERIDPGNKQFPLQKIPKVVGGLSPAAGKLAELVYRKVIKDVIIVSSARAAETVKLLENSFRLINIAFIDELAMMAHKMNLDIWEIIRAASTKPFGFMPFYPGPGVGGHCIPKDPLYLYWKARHAGFSSRFIKLAAGIINAMPDYIIGRIEALLKENKIGIRKAKILVIGATYKKDVADLRKSPAIDIILGLKKRNCKVSYYDPLIPHLKINGIDLKSVVLGKETLSVFDCTVIAVDHTGLDYHAILKHSRIILDTRNVYNGIVNEKVHRL